MSLTAPVDPDGDGLANAQEFEAGSHPMGLERRYLAEGATGFFRTTVSLFNPSNTEPTAVTLSFLGERGEPVGRETLVLAPQQRQDVDAAAVLGDAALGASVIAESSERVVMDRFMSWDRATGYGSSLERAQETPSTSLYFAEGATSVFNLYYLLENPSQSAANVTITYLVEGRGRVSRSYVVAPESRRTIWVNADPELAAANLAAVITSDVPILAERAMYMDAAGEVFGAGAAGAAASSLSPTWSFAEGATGWFDEFLLIANPSPAVLSVHARYQLPDGTLIEKEYGVPAFGRRTVWVNNEDPALADTPVAATLTARVGFVAERTMWWPSPGSSWYESHTSLGATEAGTAWAIAAGAVAGDLGVRTTEQSYVLVSNAANEVGRVRVRLFFGVEDLDPIEMQLDIEPNGRETLPISLGSLGEYATVVTGDRPLPFSVLVESVPATQGAAPVPIVVEMARYGSYDGVPLSSGASALATKVR